ncbi:hypothetical protein BsWGS_19761 [Bradybaena similaris]
MNCKRLVKLTVFLVLLQLAGYVVFSRHWTPWSIFLSPHSNKDSSVGPSQISETAPSRSESIAAVNVVNNVPTSQAKSAAVTESNTTESVSNNTTSNVVDPKPPDTPLMHEVVTLLKAQLKLNTTTPPFSVKAPCLERPKWNYACVHQNCSQLSTNVTQRVQSLISEKTVLTKDQDDLLTSIAAQIPETDVILLTAASSNHYDEMQALLHSIHSMVFPGLSKQENFSLVVWDIGLTAKQRKKTEKCCRCQVVSFPFDKFPGRLRDLRCYMWKPLVIRMSQQRARKYAVWQDASIRYVNFPGPVFEKGSQYGLQLIRQRAGVSTPHRTLPETFAYLGQQVCSFYQYPEIASGFGVYKHDPFVLKAVTNPWAKCGFDQACMCPRHSLMSYRCYYGPCHRFDQSALTIITATLYSSEVYRILLFEPDLKKYFWVGRGNKAENYFNSTGCLS